VILEQHQWQAMCHRHHERVDAWVAGRKDRKARGEQHPVDDFLFDYYPYSVSKLRTWHPGFGITLRGRVSDLKDFLDRGDYRMTSDGCTIDASALSKHGPRRELVLRLLANTSQRPAQLHCFGMHEWAMVYDAKPADIRHQTVPLRLPPEKIKETVDALGLRCTHIDAYRFFTDAAAPLNAHRPTREDQPDLEQPGCLHANMDLYKYAMWFSPFTSSNLIADCFALARQARMLDMQASPYELTAFTCDPIAVETPDGRRTYAARQAALMEQAAPLRERLLTELKHLPA
jgi:hypothetical protein